MKPKNILLMLIGMCLKINGFNISPKPNLIINEPSLITYMPKQQSSYFGYTINLRPGSIIIGAPRAQSTLELQTTINETGAIYRYSFKKKTCDPYIFDRNGNHFTKNDQYAWNSERKDFQWLGGAMDGGTKDTDPLFVCAPRLCDDSIHEYLIHGICYWTPNTLHDQPSNVRTIAPLRLKASQVIDVREQKYFYYMYGQQGISIHWTGRNEEAIIGAPGISTWKGSVIRYLSKEVEDIGGLSKRDTISKRISRQSNIDYITEVPNPDKWYQQPDSYFGYSVSSGNFDSKNLTKMLYVASAPQANKQSGEVYIFDIINAKDQFTITKYQTFHGNQFGEFFGYAILSEDLNGDGLLDLIVSAPFYATETTFDKGAVYVFINKGNLNFEKQVVLSPKNEPGRFGSTMTKLGDINRDGFNDISISAPFGTNGTVFIYLGNAYGLRDNPSQALMDPNAKDTKNQHMFGNGLSPGVDIDLNGFNDIAIGAPNAETVYLYKTYPVVQIKASIGSPKREIKMDEQNLLIKACFYLETVSTVLKSQQINVHIKADEKLKRLKFLDGGNELKFTAHAFLYEQCKEYTANVKSNLKDIFNPIELEIHYELTNKIPDTEHFCDSCSVVDPSDSSVAKEKIIFSTGCKNEICLADLKLTSLYKSSTFVIGSSKTLVIEYEILNNGETAYLPQINVTSSNRMLFAKIPSACNTQNNFIIICDLFRNRPMNKGDKDKIQIVFDVMGIEGTHMEIIAEVFSAGKELSALDNVAKNLIELKEYSTIEVIGSSDKAIISLETNLGFIEFNNEFEIKNIGPSQIKELELILSIPISYVLPKSKNRISLIDFNNITVIAEYSSYSLKVEFYQKNFLIQQIHKQPAKFSTEFQNNEGMNFDSTNNGYAVEEYIREDEYDHSMPRRKRATEAEYARISQKKIEQSVIDELIGQLPLNRTITFNCNDPEEMLCIEAVIRVYDFKHNDNEPVYINLKFITNLDEINKILIEDKEFFVITTGFNVTKIGDEGGDTIKVIQNLAHNIISKHQLSFTPIWVYIVSTIAGILLLVLITYALYRYGFFKRNTKEQLEHLVQSNQEDHEPGPEPEGHEPTEESPMNRPST